MKKYIILLSFIFIILFLVIFYLFIKYYKKQYLINNIIKEWKTQTNGTVIKDTKEYIWKNDYYLMFNNSNEYSSHIHLKVFNNTYWYLNKFFKIIELEYTPKKNNKYPVEIINKRDFIKSYTIYESISPNKIVKQMIEKYKNL